MRRARGRIRPQDMRNLLEAPPRANIAFSSGGAVEAAPVAFQFQDGRYWIGVPRTETGPRLGAGELVKLVIDDGRWYFDLRGLWIRGRTTPADRPPERAPASLAWFELAPEKVVAWHLPRAPYRAPRRVADGDS